jgi:serine phosphatase RsbU (regulator of sigma subunit)/pSer/pThr/pTyr-binding forkhead associated (FHA) protein
MPRGRRAIPTLLTICGETPGKAYKLDRDSTLIGRDLGCHIVLSRKFVSRKHARITQGPNGFEIEDLQSNCGTQVEGERIAQRVALKDGQHIKIGNYVFVFNLPSVMVTDDAGTSSKILGMLEVTWPPADEASPATVYPEEKLRHVLEITRKLGESLRLEDVLEKTLESLFKVFPKADRGFVLLKQGEEIDFTPRAIKFRGAETGNLTISRTILKHVLHEGKAILSSDAAADGRFAESHSIMGSIRTVMCVPLLDVDRRPAGILQLDTRDDRGTFGEEDLDLLVAVASQVGVAVENARLHTALIEQTQVEQESQDAHEVQLALLPERRPALPGYEFWDFYEPARYVGGDYFDYLPLASGESQGDPAPRRWLLAVADVAGKGMPAALLMARLSAEVRLFALTLSDPVRIVDRLNRDFCHRAIGERFITFLLVLVDADAHRITVVSAGHAAPIVRRVDGMLEIVGENQAGPPLGVTEDAAYTAAGVALGPGDMVLLYTDGLIDGIDTRGQAFGGERLRRLFKGAGGTATSVGRDLLRSVRLHAAGCPQIDDITVLCFQRCGAAGLPAPDAVPVTPPS